MIYKQLQNIYLSVWWTDKTLGGQPNLYFSRPTDLVGWSTKSTIIQVGIPTWSSSSNYTFFDSFVYTMVHKNFHGKLHKVSHEMFHEMVHS